MADKFEHLFASLNFGEKGTVKCEELRDKLAVAKKRVMKMRKMDERKYMCDMGEMCHRNEGLRCELGIYKNHIVNADENAVTIPVLNGYLLESKDPPRAPDSLFLIVNECKSSTFYAPQLNQTGYEYAFMKLSDYLIAMTNLIEGTGATGALDSVIAALAENEIDAVPSPIGEIYEVHYNNLRDFTNWLVSNLSAPLTSLAIKPPLDVFDNIYNNAALISLNNGQLPPVIYYTVSGFRAVPAFHNAIKACLRVPIPPPPVLTP